MHVAQVKLEDIQRGSLLMVAGGYVVAEGISTAGTPADPKPFMYDTDGGRHFPNSTDGTLTVAMATFRTQAAGQVKGGFRHALLNEVPGKRAQAYCPDARRADLDVWQSGTALAGVDCPGCRKLIGLVSTLPQDRVRRSTGI